jgi:hypothetical protein
MSSPLATTAYRFTEPHEYEPVSASSWSLKQEWESHSDVLQGTARNWLPAVRAALFTIGRECNHDGWDGEGSYAVEPATIGIAAKVAQAMFVSLPLGTLAPDVMPDADGEVILEWIVDQQRVLSLSVGSNGRASYAGRFGQGGSTHGWLELKLSDLSELEQSLDVVVASVRRLLREDATGHTT